MGQITVTGRITVRVVAAAASVAAAAASGEAGAGGFALKERSAAAQGLSFAGVTAGSGGPSSMGFNPAAIGVIEDGAVAGGLSYIQPVTEGDVIFAGSSVQTIDADQPGVVGNFYAGYRIKPDNLLLGLAVTSPFGLKTSYDDDFVGRFDGKSSELLTFQVSPIVGLEVIDGLTLAVQGNIFYADARLSSGFINLEGDDLMASFAAGALWQVTDTTTLGIAYDHGYDLSLKGDAEGFLTGGFVFTALAEAELPATVSFGVVQEITDDIRVMGEVQWQNWSVFDDIDIELITQFGTQSLSEAQNYRDAWFVALGGEYDVTNALTVRAGAAWDQTPTQDSDPAAGFEGRSVRVPDEDRVWLSLGASYDVSERLTIDGGYSFLFALEDPVVTLRTQPATVVYDDARAHIFSVGGSFRF